MNDMLIEIIRQDQWMRFNAIVSIIVFGLLMLRSDSIFRWPDGRDCLGKAIVLLGRISLIAVLTGCIGNIQDWWLGDPHRPSEVLLNAGMALFLIARVAELYLPRRSSPRVKA